MANSYIEYTSGLTATTYDVPFNVLSITDVNVKGYNGTTWSDLAVASRDAVAKTITLSVAPSAYQKIRIWRNTGTTQLVDFQNGSRLSESDLDTAYQQGLFVAQEVSENASTEVEGIGPQGIQGIQGQAGADPFDASGNILVGASTAAGDTSNTKSLIAGLFSTKNGTTSIASAGVATTLVTFNNNDGNFIVSARASGTGNIEDNTTAIVHLNANGTSKIATILAGTRVVLSMSGNDLQVSQSVFAGANITWSVMRIR